MHCTSCPAPPPSPGCWWRRVLHRRTKLGTLARRIGVAITVVSVTSTMWTIAEVVVDDTTPTHEQVGLAQRIQLIALAVGVAYIASLSWADLTGRPGQRYR